MRYYVDGEAIYAGLVYWEGYYYYISSTKRAVRNLTYTTSTTNGLLPIAAYTFDEYGRMMDPPDGSYGRLAGTEDVTISYQYDANGMRTGKTVTRTDKTTGTQTVHAYAYIYNGSQLSQMTVDGHTLRFSYDSGKPMFVKYDGVTYQYILNLQGDVIGIMNHAGTVVVEYVYDAWGNILSVTGSHASTVGRYNPLRYRSYVFDSETGLYYLQSRYYNPEWGRFINADTFVSTGQDILGNNMFAYCYNNPVNYSDSTGNFPWHILAAALISGGVSMIATLMSGGSLEDILKSGFSGALIGAAISICPELAVVFSSYELLSTLLDCLYAGYSFEEGLAVMGLTAISQCSAPETGDTPADKMVQNYLDINKNAMCEFGTNKIDEQNNATVNERAVTQNIVSMIAVGGYSCGGGGRGATAICFGYNNLVKNGGICP